jgi:DNA polymerase III epsilon subunit-like protein
MSKKICILYTETNGLHETKEPVSKKNLYAFARLVVLNYEIVIFEKDKFITKKFIRNIIKPRCMFISEESTQIHGITNEYATNNGIDIEIVLNNFLKDIQDVSFIVSHNLEFHLNTLLSEYVRYNIYINIKNYILLDTISFFHKEPYLKLVSLYNHLYGKKKKSEITNIQMIKEIFLKLYLDYKKTL